MSGGWLFAVAMRRRLTSRATEQIGTLALALAIYFSSIALGGNGFIPAFVGGLFFSYVTRHRQHHAVEFTEAAGTILSLFVWTIFGSILVIPLFTAFNLMALLYAVLSPTLIRMLPVALSLYWDALPARHAAPHWLVGTTRPGIGRIHPHRL